MGVRSRSADGTFLRSGEAPEGERPFARGDFVESTATHYTAPMRFDWKDALILPLGFLGMVLGMVQLQKFGFELSKPAKQGLAVAALFGPLALRRKFFGEPELPEPRTGFLPSAGSVLGLLATFFGTALIALGGYHLTNRPAKPDFLAQERSYQGSFEFDFVEGAETEEEGAARREREREARLVEGARESERSWEEGEAEFVTRYQRILAVGLGLAALGAFGVKSRYPSGRPA